MFTVLHPVRDKTMWMSVLHRMGPFGADPHFSPEYLDAEHLAVPGSAGYLAVYDDGMNPVAKPFVMRPVIVGKSYGWDVTSPHGYGGPVGLDGWQHDRFDEGFIRWCSGADVICEYMALNPMQVPHQRHLLGWRWTWPVVDRKQVVWIDIAQAKFSHERRTGTNAARKAGVIVFTSAIDQPHALGFVKMYGAAMERKGAPARWRFPNEYLMALCRAGRLFTACVDGKAECTSLVLTGRDVAYYHMTAASPDRDPKHRANDLLVSAIVDWCRESGIKMLHLGGGVTSAPDDGVLAFKASFSDLRASAMSTFRVFDEARYQDACAAKARTEVERTGAEFTTRFEPMYRREQV
jgi:hypothetical protein